MRSFRFGRGSEESDEDPELSFLPNFNPVTFFQINGSVPRFEGGNELSKEILPKALLPDLSVLTGEKKFADVYMAWSKEGLFFQVIATVDSVESAYPIIQDGDSVEIMIDTRDIKTSGYNTRFCHHFFFLVKAVEGKMCGEITKFRTEDTHPLSLQADLICKAEMQKNGYILKIFIPSQSLYGYDPEQFNRLGLTYRINSSSGSPQHFSVVTEEYQIEQQPHAWSSIVLSP